MRYTTRVPRYDFGGMMNGGMGATGMGGSEDMFSGGGMGNMGGSQNMSQDLWSWVQPYEKYWMTDRFKQSGFDNVKQEYENKKKNAKIKTEGGRQAMGVFAGLIGASGITDELGLPVDDWIENTAVGQTEGYQATTGTERIARGVVKAYFGDYYGGAASIVKGGGDFADLARVQGVRKGNFKMYRNSAIAGDSLRTASRVIGTVGSYAGGSGKGSQYSGSWLESANKFKSNPYFSAATSTARQGMGTGLSAYRDMQTEDGETNYNMFKYGGTMTYSRIPRYDMGGGMGGMGGGNPVTGIIGMIVNAVKAKKEKKKAEEEAARQDKLMEDARKDQHLNWSEGVLNNWAEKGVGNVDYYAGKGVKILPVKSKAIAGQLSNGIDSVRGGDLIPVASNAHVAVGDTHQEDTDKDGSKGITLSSGNEDVAEIENNEVAIDKGANGIDIHSDQRYLPNGKTIAEDTTYWATFKGKAEKKLNSSDRFEAGTASANVRKANKHIEGNFQYQEMLNALDKSRALSYKMKAACGGKVKKYAGTEPDNTISFQGAPEGYNWSGGNSYEGTPSLPATNTDGYTFGVSDSINNSDQTYNYDLGWQGGGYSGVDANGNAYSYNPNANTTDQTAKGKSNLNWQQFAKMAGNTLGNASRFIDNAAIAAMLRKYPDLRPPTFQKAAYLPINYNISPTVAELKNTAMNAKTSIDRNTAQSNVARAQKLNIDAKLISAMNTLYQQKAENERTAMTDSAKINAEIAKNNVDITNQYAVDQFNRDSQKWRIKAANWANIASDAQQMYVEGQARTNTNNEMQAYSKLGETSGSYYNMMGNDSFDQSMLTDGKSMAKFYSSKLTGIKKQRWDTYYGL